MQRRFGIIAVAVVMFFVTIILGILSTNGKANPAYLLLWIMVGWYGFKNDLQSIANWMKWVIWVSIGASIFLYLFVGDNSNSIAWHEKNLTVMVVAIMLIPKIALYYYCKMKINESEKSKMIYADYSASINLETTNAQNNNKGEGNINFDSSRKDMKISQIINESEFGNDEIFYEKALEEYEGNRRKGLWIKILSKNEGDEVKSKFEYIRTRARDIEMEESALNEKQKEQAKEQVKEHSPNDNIDNFQNKKESSMEVLDFTPSIEFMPMKLPKNNGSNGSAKLLIPSVALSVVVGAVPMQRTEVISKIWVYIKGHNLQDANNRRKIIADDNLRKIFGKSEFTLFEMAQLVNKHLK